MLRKRIRMKFRPEDIGKRLDSVCAEVFDISRSYAAIMIEEGRITVNGVISSKNYKIKAGDEAEYSPPEPILPDAQPEDIEIDIVYEDEHLAVVNKPKGMVVHPAPGNYTGTMVSALLYKMKGRLSTINGVVRPGIVHRIDKDTSGLLIVAKTDEAHIALAEQIKEHSFLRRYHAIVCGNIKNDCGTVDKPVGRHPKDRVKMAVTNVNSKNAVTDYEVIERYNSFTYISCKLHTGRTHQIRVHMSSLGHPLMGDELYGGGKSKFETQNASLLCGQCLHAKTVGFVHPITGEEMFFDSELPEYFKTVLDKLKK